MNIDTKPLVSIVVLTYNGLEFLHKTVEPLLTLSYPNLEIIYVDNASTDTSVEYLSKFDRIKVVRNEKNEGFNKGKNIGIKHAQGEYVFSLDGDMLIHDPDLIECLLGCFTEKTGIVQLPLFDVDKQLTKYYGIYFTKFGINRNIKWISKKDVLRLPEVVPIASATGACLFFKKSAWDQLDGFDESQVYHLDESDIGPRFSIFGYNNILYTKRILTHLGVKHAANPKLYAYRYRYLFSGEGISIIKNYSKANVFICFCLFSLYQLIKALRYTVLKRNVFVFVNFCYSVKIFFEILPNALKKRSEYQRRRIVQKDLFLEIRPPRII